MDKRRSNLLDDRGVNPGGEGIQVRTLTYIFEFEERRKDDSDAGRNLYERVRNDVAIDANLEELELGRRGESDGEFPGCEDMLSWDMLQLQGEEVLRSREKPWQRREVCVL